MFQNSNEGLMFGIAPLRRTAGAREQEGRTLEPFKVDAGQTRPLAPRPRALPQGALAQNFRSFTR